MKNYIIDYLHKVFGDFSEETMSIHETLADKHPLKEKDP